MSDFPRMNNPLEGMDPPEDLEGPSYYTRWKIQPLDFCMANNLPFWAGNVVKYILRYDEKDGLSDLKKARVYLDRKIAEMEEE